MNQFNDIAKDTLDEWIYFLKKEEIKDGSKAKGLMKAKKQLDVLKLSETERKEYEYYIEQQRYERGLIVSNYKVGEMKGERKGERKERKKIAKQLKQSGVDVKIISRSTGLSIFEIEKNVNKQKPPGMCM